MFDILNIKQSFFNENEKLLNECKRAFAIYQKQPLRTHCKLCGGKLPSEGVFTYLDVAFFLCECCGHVNGGHQDTFEYATMVYSDEYARFYKEPAREYYINRLEAIYIPKALFLINFLQSLNAINLKEVSFLDVGAGCGYMVGALHRLGCRARGVEVGREEVEYGNRMLEATCLTVHPQEEMISVVENASEQVVTFIGVLEHISDLSPMLEALRNNKNIRYIFFSVPMFSLSNILGIVFPDILNRQIGYTHTHLFSRGSLEWMYKKYGFECLAEWNFGTDVVDLYRSILVKMQNNKASDSLSNLVSDFFKGSGDAIQLLVDKSHFCSEVHVLVEVKRGGSNR